MRLIRNMRAGARLWADSTDSQTTGRETKKKKKLWVRGVTWREEGQSNFLYFCHMKPPRNICDRNRRPRRHGGLSLCWRQIFILPIWGWCEQEIFLLIISERALKKEEKEKESSSTGAPVKEHVQELTWDLVAMSFRNTLMDDKVLTQCHL